MKFIVDYQVPYDAEHLKPIIPPNEQMDKAIEALNIMAKTIREQIVPTVRKLIETLTPICKVMTDVLKTHPNKRVVYLATHGKKRVRKKNIKRIIKWAKRGCKQ